MTKILENTYRAVNIALVNSAAAVAQTAFAVAARNVAPSVQGNVANA